jgi:hypothetical protein
MNTNAIAHHGTVWDKPLIPSIECIENSMMINEISSEMNELDAFFMSQNKSVCEFFSDLKFIDDENQMQAIINIEFCSERTVELSFFSGPSIKYDGGIYDYSDNQSRSELYATLKDKDIQLLIVKDDYNIEDHGAGDDIAVFDTSILRCVSVDLKIDGEWRRGLSLEKARSIFLTWSEIDSKFCNDSEASYA